MSSVSRLEADLELKTSAVKFLEIFALKVYELSTFSPNIIQNIDILSGEWGTPGFVILVNYTLVDGKAQVAKEVVESIDLIDLSITFKVVEGDLLEEYNSFKFILKVSPTIIGGGSVVHWTFEYEKPNEDTPNPNSLMEEVLQVSKDIDAFVANLI
ncbi:MLP-like protein 31 [Senna tora]|uniref:MLP-like protein 31 n=1 Tax=Senna tora TaxID=362788 RepID=A0A834SSA8_9FABA|nr:MLP-like protein 31 [Senna tora]